MTQPLTPVSENELLEKQRRFQNAGRLHWFHWFIIGCSLLITLSAWYFTQNQLQQKIEVQFNRQADHVIELITERMQKYEDALWSGVAAIQSQSHGIDYNEWQRYAKTLKIDQKYPGINGIGVIFHIEPSELTTFLEKERQVRPDFSIYPAHNEDEYLPITFIEPVANNRQAVGLDMAHETNRYSAAKKARDTGEPQMTAPIVLVQDSEKTPGFLLFVPFYRQGFSPNPDNQNIEPYRDNFVGMVYAPFIMKKLMKGALSGENRLVNVQLRDNDQILYDEYDSQSFSADSLSPYKRTVTMDMYGRPWTLNIWGNNTFLELTRSSQPMIILAVGIFIDIMLLGFFMLLAKSNRNAVEFAKQMAREYQHKAEELEEVNTELEEFTYRTSHDLRSPLTSSIGLLNIAQKSLKKAETEKATLCINHAEKSLDTLKDLVEDIMHLARTKMLEEPDEEIDMDYLITETLKKLHYPDDQTALIFTRNLNFTQPLVTKKLRFITILENLLSNAIKYRDVNQPSSEIMITTEEKEGQFILSVADNGLGIPENRRDKLFHMFKRFHPETATGSGLGLYMARKSAQLLGGNIVYTDNGKGSTFTLSIPLPPQE